MRPYHTNGMWFWRGILHGVPRLFAAPTLDGLRAMIRLTAKEEKDIQCTTI